MDQYVTHEGEKYLVVGDSEQYVRKLAEKFFVGSKFASITAVRGRVGQIVKTIMKNGLTETTNVVSYDPATGCPDWIVTQASGEQMVVTDSKFKSIYQLPENMQEGQEIKPTGLYRPMVILDENVAIRASWGETQFIKKGGVLVAMASNDIYGIQSDEFFASYDVIEGEDGRKLFNENMAKKPETRKPQIFLSVAVPYENEDDMRFMQQIIQYVNSKGIKAVNIKKIEDNNINLVNEILVALKDSEGILSLAFNKGENRTSPFIQIETALATSLNLETLLLRPEIVQKEGMLFEDNVDGHVCLICSDDLYSEENSDLLARLNEFIDRVIERYDMKINDKDLIQFKNAFTSNDKKAKCDLVNFLKHFYNIADKDFKVDELYVKRPIKIKAFVVEKDDYYTTKDGVVFLREGDFLVSDIDETVLPYAVTKENFKARYLKVNGTENTYITKFLPTVAKNIDDKKEVYSLFDTKDIYEVDKVIFNSKYQSLKDYILNLDKEKYSSDDNINEL